MSPTVIDPRVEFAEVDLLIGFFRNRNLLLAQQLFEARARIAVLEAAAVPTVPEAPPAADAKALKRRSAPDAVSAQVAEGEVG